MLHPKDLTMKYKFRNGNVDTMDVIMYTFTTNCFRIESNINPQYLVKIKKINADGSQLCKGTIHFAQNV